MIELISNYEFIFNHIFQHILSSHIVIASLTYWSQILSIIISS